MFFYSGIHMNPKKLEHPPHICRRKFNTRILEIIKKKKTLPNAKDHLDLLPFRCKKDNQHFYFFFKIF